MSVFALVRYRNTEQIRPLVSFPAVGDCFEIEGEIVSCVAIEQRPDEATDRLIVARTATKREVDGYLLAGYLAAYDQFRAGGLDARVVEAAERRWRDNRRGVR